MAITTLSKRTRAPMNAVAATLVFALSLCACASNPREDEHRGAGGANRLQGAERPSVFVRPGALLLLDAAPGHALTLTKAQFEAAIPVFFAEADANHDGELSPLELQTFLRAHLGSDNSTPTWVSFDANGDHRITKAEFTASLEALFAKFDGAHDGVITRAAMVERLDAAAPRPQRSEASTPGESGERGERGERGRRGGGAPPGE